VTAPSAAGQGVQVIGVARSASQLVVMPGLDYATNAGETQPVATPMPSAEPVVLPTPEPASPSSPRVEAGQGGPSVAPEASGSAISQ